MIGKGTPAMSATSVAQPAVQLTTTGAEIVTPAGAYARDPTVLGGDAEHLGVLVDLHSQGISSTGVTPIDCVVADDPPRRVVKRTEDRVPDVGGDVHIGDEGLDLIGRDHLGVDSLELVDLGPPAHRAQRAVGVGQRQVAPLGEHDVEIEVSGQGAVKPHRERS